MSYVFSKKSVLKLQGVHPDLVKVITLALSYSKQDFSITEGVRTKEQQALYVRTGKSQTMNSKHLVQSDGFSHAIDVVPYPVSWNLEKFYPIADAVKKASKELGITVRWGGAWVNLNASNQSARELVESYSKARRKTGNKVFIDAPHFELVK